MDGRNNHVTANALEAMTNVILRVNQNHNRGTDGFRGLGKFHRNNPPTFKCIYDPEGPKTWLREIEKIFHEMACNED